MDMHDRDAEFSPAFAVLPLASAYATPESLQAAIKEVTGGKPLREGKVSIDIPTLVENGNTVPLGVWSTAR